MAHQQQQQRQRQPGGNEPLGAETDTNIPPGHRRTRAKMLLRIGCANEREAPGSGLSPNLHTGGGRDEVPSTNLLWREDVAEQVVGGEDETAQHGRLHEE